MNRGPEDGIQRIAEAEQKVALIPGGARGIGRAIALALAREGWAVALCYRKSQSAAESTSAEIAASGGKVLAEACDVSSAKASQRLVTAVEQRWGRIDALINCAGPYHRIPLLEETPEGWCEMFDGNLHSLFYLARAAAPGMQQRGWGRIISFGLANADQGLGQTHVTAHYIAKAGVVMLTRALAKALAPSGITANTISPGFIDSGGIPAIELEQRRRQIPAGAIGSVDDVVSVVRFLLSEQAHYLNGANIQLSGAWGI
jgi:3-oxoacyl-[acyl-carrier protein] reductase